jgi:hypothetical protein
MQLEDFEMTDRYTKSMLTIIAACLVWNIVASMSGPRQALAQSGPVHVIVDYWGAYLATFPIPVKAN